MKLSQPGSMFQGDVYSTHVLRGVVVAVNPVRYTVSLRPLTPQYNQLWADVQYLSPYLSSRGSGISFVPEVGSIGYLAARGDDPYRWFVIGWGALSDEKEKARLGEPSYRQGRPIMDPGDIRLSGRRGNDIRLLAGGVVQIRSSGLAMRQYIPIDNIIRDFCERYHLRSLAGDLKFEVDEEDQPLPDGEFSSRVRLNVYEKTNDNKPIGELLIGEQGGDTNLSLRLRGSGSSQGEVVVSLVSDKNGNLTCTVTNDLKLIGETAELEGKSRATVKSDSLVTVEAPTMEATVGNVIFKPGAGVGQEFKVLHPTVRLQSPSVRLGSGPMAGVVRGTEFMTWAGQVSAMLAALGAPPALLPTIVSTSVKVGI